jgi:isocitrate dehydrogenase (NAD+)
VATDAPEIKYNELIVDNAAMQLVTHPEQFDVLTACRTFTATSCRTSPPDCGRLGRGAGRHIGDNHACLRAVHGSAPDIAGRGIANPTALLLSSVMMLRHMLKSGADQLQAAIEPVYRKPRTSPEDVGGKATTLEFADAVIAKLG